MAEKKVPISVTELRKQLAEAEAAAKAAKGIQKLTAVAYVDPNSLCQFKIKEDVFAHFEIKLPDYVETDTVYGTDTTPKSTSTGAGTKTNPKTVTDTGAGSIQKRSQQLVGKAIKVPTNGSTTTYLQRTIKGVAKNIKYVTIRVPSSMSVSAIILWINTCFGQANKRPGSFIMPSGARVSLNPQFTDKTKLPSKK